jgi:hypothetical protein
MTNSRVDAVALFAAMIAAGLGLMLLTGQMAWLSSIAGLVLLFTIFAYDNEGYRSVFQSLAFSAVCGFCFVLAAAAGLRFWAAQNASSGPNARVDVEQFAVLWLPLTWVCATLIFWAIDRARMKSREAARSDYGGETVTRARGRLSIVGDAAPIRHPEVVLEERPTAPTPQPAPVPVVQNEVGPVPVPGPASVPLREAIPQSAVPVRPLKEAMVYVGLVGEGLNVMRSVRAEHLGRNYYKIVEPMPEGERWEYGPGQVVRCEKKKLSTGKALVAVEEAPRKV